MDDDADDGEKERQDAHQKVQRADQVAAIATERRTRRQNEALRATERRHRIRWGVRSVHIELFNCLIGV